MKSSSNTPDNQQNSSIFPPLESPLRTSSTYSRGAISNDQYFTIKLQEQIRQYRDEIQSKDKIIEDMRRIDVATDSFRLTSFQNTNSNDANLNAKITTLQMEIAEYTKMKSQQDIMMEALRNSNSSLKLELRKLKESLETAEKHQMEKLNNLKARNDVVITNLQQELGSKKEQLLELNIQKNELSCQLSELSEHNDKLIAEMKELRESFMAELPNSSGSIQEIVDEVKSVRYENKSLLIKIEEMDVQLKSKDCEQQASRQTINRLVTKLEAQETKIGGSDDLVASLKKEKEDVEECLKSQSEELEAVKCTMATLKEEMAIMKTKNDTKDARIDELQLSIKNKSVCPIGPEKLLQKLMENLIPLLEETFTRTQNDDNAVEWIIDCVYNLTKTKHSSQLAIDFINSECEIPPQVNQFGRSSSTVELTNENTAHQTIDQLQITCDDFKTRLDRTSRELMHANVVIDGLNCDKTKYMRVLMELSRLMKLDDINKDIGMDMITEALYARTNQLQQLETHNKTQKRLVEHGQTRRIKELEERLRNKELHIEVLQKKATQNLEKSHNEKDREKERDRELASNKRLASQNHQLTNQIGSLREEVVHLKGRLLEQEQIRAINVSLDSEVKSLTEKLDKLESIRQRQCKKLADMKTKEGDAISDAESVKNEAQSRVMELSTQLQSTMEALELSKKKEQQMSDLRAVVSRLLGLDISNLSIPDYEIINRLERLITAHQSNVYTAYTTDSSLREINQGVCHDPCVAYSNCDSRKFIEPIYPKVDQQAHRHHHNIHHRSLNDVSNRITPKCWAE